MLRLAIDGLAAGGDGVARDGDGRVVFVPGGLPGDRVEARVVSAKRRWARAELVAVLEPSPQRIVPPCAHARAGCGGCAWQALALDAQRSAKVQIVRDALARVGGIADEGRVVAGPALEPWGFRTTVRAAVVEGRAALRRAGSHDALVLDACPVAHPQVEAALVHGRFGAANEVTLRVGAATGEGVALVDPSAHDVAGLPDGYAVVGRDELDAGAPGPVLHEEVAGRRWRISPRSFFQSRADGTELLVERVGVALGAAAAAAGTAPPDHVVDAYGGVGLLSAAAPMAARVTLVESNASSIADARVNLGAQATVVHRRVERWAPEPAAAVIADPARAGLGAGGATVLAGTGARVLVLVSCDAAPFGRDAAELARHGFALGGSEVLDLFPHTPHVEVVSWFWR